MYRLPTLLSVNNREYAIREKGDFRMVLDCFKALEDEELTKEERIIASLIIFLEDVDTVQDVYNLPDIESVYKEMVRFFNCGQDSVNGRNTNFKLLDWDKDASMICSAVNKVAGTEIRAMDYLHWWTFMGYYMAVGQSSLSTVVGIRYKIARGKKLEKYEKEFKQDNPQYFNFDMRSLEDRELDKEIRDLWNRNSAKDRKE